MINARVEVLGRANILSRSWRTASTPSAAVWFWADDGQTGLRPESCWNDCL